MVNFYLKIVKIFLLFKKWNVIMLGKVWGYMKSCKGWYFEKWNCLKVWYFIEYVRCNFEKGRDCKVLWFNRILIGLYVIYYI